MNNSRSLWQRGLRCVCVAVLAATLGLSVQAQVLAQVLPTLTPDQQRALDAMSPAQREALLRQFGVTPPPATVAPSSSGNEPGIGALTMATPDEQQSPPPRTGLDSTDTIILILSPRDERRLTRKEESLKDRINQSNPFRLDKSGRLGLPDLGEIALGGLTRDQASVRLGAVPGLGPFDIELHILPVDDPDGPELEPFGYRVFAQDAQRFAAGGALPVPSDYAIGPGDIVQLQYYGSTSGQYELRVDRDGMLSLPQLGPVRAAGLSFNALREEVRLRVGEQMIGTEVSVTLGELRSIRVFLVGDVAAPGAYQVSAYATLTTVLALGGGVTEAGSLRRIQQKRDGRMINTFDLYQLLLQGDASRDRRVANGDVVFVPPVGNQVAVAGEVKRAAIYEYRDRLTVAEAVQLAGGAQPGALRRAVRVERGSPADGLTVFEVNLDSIDGAKFALESGDRVVLAGATPQLDNAVSLSGHVFRPGIKPWRPGLRLSSVLASPRDVKPQADLGYILVQRQKMPNGPIEVFSADLGRIWARDAKGHDPELQPRDQIVVFSIAEERDAYLKPVLERLRLQAGSFEPTAVVTVDGQVKRPGTYPLEEGMTVADLIRAGGGLTEAAYRELAELRRYGSDVDGQRGARLIDIALLDETAGRGSFGEPLQSADHLSVKTISNWGENDFLEIRGEVLFPGRYALQRGETLGSVLRRAGGLSDTAFPEGTILIRESLRERERQQLEELAARIESDLATMELSNSGQGNAIGIGQSLLRQIRSTDPTGRLVIDMQAIVDGEASADVLVRDGDSLFVPKRSQEITVVGEVQYATSHLWQSGLDRGDYIERSGGVTARADRKRIYIVRASGEVLVNNRSRFYSRAGTLDIQPGDTIVVPLKTDRIAPLVLWSSATQIVYNLAIAAAAVASF